MIMGESTHKGRTTLKVESHHKERATHNVDQVLSVSLPLCVLMLKSL